MITVCGLPPTRWVPRARVARSQLEDVMSQDREPAPGRSRPPDCCRRTQIGLDTDHRTIPNEIGLLGVAVHLDKGCYRGQETVARVHTRKAAAPAGTAAPGRQRRCTASSWGGAGARGRGVGFVGGSARHYELGPIALGLIKRGTPLEAPLTVDGIAQHRSLYSIPTSAPRTPDPLITPHGTRPELPITPSELPITPVGAAASRL